VRVSRRPDALLADQAYLEKKAAVNALDIFGRCPDKHPRPAHWARALAVLAREETAHLAAVCDLMRRRGVRWERRHANPYAQGLHALIRLGDGPRELTDRLLVSALVEARSGERFHLLSRYGRDAELRKFYRTLASAEAGHGKLFLRLAEGVAGREAARARWKELVEAEGHLLAGLPFAYALHGGPPV
jgi:tRNA-(ms[2]io[6]A)-hydroxylase